MGAISPSPSSVSQLVNKQLGRVLLRNSSSEQYPLMSIDLLADIGRYKSITDKQANVSTRVPKDEVEEALLLLLLYEDSLTTIRTEDLTLFDDLCLLYCKRFGYSNLVEVCITVALSYV
jgi:hypothetical protein